MGIISSYKKFTTKLKNRFRVSLYNDTTHAELFSTKATGGKFLGVLLMTTSLIFIMLFLIIAFTPLRELIPGYPSLSQREAVIQNALKADSLEKELNLWALQLTNIQRIVNGEEPLKLDSLVAIKGRNISTSEIDYKYAKEDSILRQEFINKELSEISSIRSEIKQIDGLLFFVPVKGVITESFNRGINHPFIDIAAKKNSPVHSVLDGTVISAEWNNNTGYTIQLQHNNDIISIYKHNSKLLHKSGDKVKAGSQIAFVGNTGELSSGAHLHFELWYKGEPVDPAKYINF